jgi:uncharacterized protein
MRFLLLLGLFLAVVWLVRGGRRAVPGDNAAPPSSPPPEGAAPSEEMVACLHCGVHLPQGEAVSGAAGWYCGAAHRDMHPGESPR